MSPLDLTPGLGDPDQTGNPGGIRPVDDPARTILIEEQATTAQSDDSPRDAENRTPDEKLNQRITDLEAALEEALTQRDAARAALRIEQTTTEELRTENEALRTQLDAQGDSRIAGHSGKLPFPSAGFSPDGKPTRLL